MSRTGASRSEIDDDAIFGLLITGVHQGPFDAMHAFAHGRFGQADEHGLRQGPGRDVDFDFHGHGVDADERERV